MIPQQMDGQQLKALILVQSSHHGDFLLVTLPETNMSHLSPERKRKYILIKKASVFGWFKILVFGGVFSFENEQLPWVKYRDCFTSEIRIEPIRISCTGF